MKEKVEVTLGRLIGWALLLVTLATTPLWALDPINPVKMMILVAVSVMCLGVLIVHKRSFESQKYRTPNNLISIFIIWQLLVLGITSANKWQQFFGTNGRNTGFLTYFAFSVLFIASVAASNEQYLRKFNLFAVLSGSLSIAYGVIQATGKDPFDWVNPYSPVFGFLGNPNFQSSFLGLLGGLVFTQILSNSATWKLKAGYFLYLLATLYVIKETDSQQGFLVLIVGCGVSLGMLIYKKLRALGVAYHGLSLIGFVGILLGTLNKGPLASLLYKDSVTYRGDYWRAGWKMTLENPLFGVGLDSYGDWYRRTRTLEATLRRGPDIQSNAAHNVFLDISSYGGFPLLVIYALLTALVIRSAIRVIKQSKEFNANFVGIVAAWVAFQAQSIISINQIGLGIWGWVLSGLIIGYEINAKGLVDEPLRKLGKKPLKPVQSSASTTLAMFLGLIIGVLVGMPPYMASAKYKGALETSNPEIIQKAAYIWPLDPSRMIQVATTLDQNKLGDQGLEIASDAVVKFPDNFGAWSTLFSMSNASEQQKAEALTQMKRLDPLNPNLK